MAAAIPAAIGLGGSVIGGISGKGAAKRQERLAREQMAQLKPLLDLQIQTGQYALGQSKPYITGAGQALTDLQNNFYKPLAFGNRSAIDAFLAPERRSINQGYRSVANNITSRAPRGSAVSALVEADMQRQGQLSDLVFNARRTGAQGMGQTATQLGSLGTGLLGAGLGAGQQGLSLLQGQQQRAQNASQRSRESMGQLGQSLGSFLGQLFGGEKSGGVDSRMKALEDFNTPSFNPFQF